MVWPLIVSGWKEVEEKWCAQDAARMIEEF